MPLFYVHLYPLELLFNEFVGMPLSFSWFNLYKTYFPSASALKRYVINTGQGSEAVCKYLSAKKSIILMFCISTVLLFFLFYKCLQPKSKSKYLNMQNSSISNIAYICHYSKEHTDIYYIRLFSSTFCFINYA